MKKGILKTFLLIVLLVLAVVLGKAGGSALAGVHGLSWLAMSAKFGVSTVTVDLSVLQLTFGMMVNISVLQAILLLAAILFYTRIH
jgi:hypothetical protein